MWVIWMPVVALAVFSLILHSGNLLFLPVWERTGINNILRIISWIKLNY